MILHAASIATLFLDQLVQAPVQVQCVLPASVDPGWRQWIQPTLNLVSIVTVVGIAIWSLGATSRKEHRRWVLDQKKAEWRELFIALTEVKKKYLPIYENEETAKSFTENWNEMEKAIDAIAMPLIFIAQSLVDIEFYGAWQDFKDKASNDRDSILELIRNQLTRLLQGTESGQIQSTYIGVENEYMRLVFEMRKFAEEDLDIKTAVKPLWRLYGSRVRKQIKHRFGGSDEKRQDQAPAAEE